MNNRFFTKAAAAAMSLVMSTLSMPFSVYASDQQIMNQTADDNDDKHVKQSGKNFPGHVNCGSTGTPFVDHIGDGSQNAADNEDFDSGCPEFAHVF